MPNRILKTTGLLTVLLTALLLTTTGTFAQDAKSSDKPAAEEKKEQPPPGLAELVSRSSELNERLNRLESQIGTVFDLTAAKEWYDNITEKLDKLTQRVEEQKSVEKPTYQDLAELKAAIRARDNANNDQIENITEAIRRVES